MSHVTLNEVPVSACLATVPGRGAWWANVTTTEETDLAEGSAAVVRVGSTAMRGTVLSGGVVEGRGAYRIVGGKGRWGKRVKRKPYLDDAGVKVASVLTDLARDAGELLGPLPSARLGSHFARFEGPAFLVLNDCAPEWYVDYEGVTQIGKRPTTTYAGDAPRTRIDSRLDVVELAVEEVTGLVPGVVVDGRAPASDVEYVLEDGRLTARLFAGRVLSREQEALRAIVLGLFPQLAYVGVWEYRVLSMSGVRLNLQAVRTATGLPDLANVPTRGSTGIKSKIKAGAQVLVVFADNSPSRPQVIAHDAPGTPGWIPIEVQLGDDPALGIARVGDTVQAGPYLGVITGSSARIKASL